MFSLPSLGVTKDSRVFSLPGVESTKDLRFGVWGLGFFGFRGFRYFDIVAAGGYLRKLPAPLQPRPRPSPVQSPAAQP